MTREKERAICGGWKGGVDVVLGRARDAAFCKGMACWMQRCCLEVDNELWLRRQAEQVRKKLLSFLTLKGAE